MLVAQSTTSLHGVISDAKGAVLPGATVKIYDAQTGFTRTVTSGGDGVYQFLQIPPATYAVTVTAGGFAVMRRENVTLLVNSPATLNFTMQVEGATIKVEVTSEAPQVNTQDASIGNAFTERQLIRLPSEGRDPVSILSLQPGVTFIGSDKQIDQSNDSRGGSVSGARSDQTNITLDGLDDNEQLLGNAFQGALRATLDSIQEFRVTTSNGNADEGRSSGGQVSLVTKSGTNAFHGSAYEYNRSSIGEANDWFNKAAEISSGLPNKPGHLIRNTFGATVGGPLQKDRMFFFCAYEGQRKRETTQVTQTIPSTELRSGTMQYVCDPSADSNCVTGSPNANGFTVVSDPRAGLNSAGQPTCWCSSPRPNLQLWIRTRRPTAPVRGRVQTDAASIPTCSAFSSSTRSRIPTQWATCWTIAATHSPERPPKSSIPTSSGWTTQSPRMAITNCFSVATCRTTISNWPRSFPGSPRATSTPATTKGSRPDIRLCSVRP